MFDWLIDTLICGMLGHDYQRHRSGLLACTRCAACTAGGRVVR